jgi:hypothetical protein
MGSFDSFKNATDMEMELRKKKHSKRSLSQLTWKIGTAEIAVNL